MEYGGRISPNVPSFGQADEVPASFDHGIDSFFLDPPKLMRAGGDQQRCIVRIDGVEMNPQGNKLGHQIGRRFDVMYAGLHGPVGKPGRVYPVSDCNGPILMPAERPVGRCALVECDRPYWLRRPTAKRFHNFRNCLVTHE